jgi:hypothetical protein
MVVLVASLENGTYEKEYAKGGSFEETEFSIEELTNTLIHKKVTPVSEEKVKKHYYTEEPRDLERWKQIQDRYQKQAKQTA